MTIKGIIFDIKKYALHDGPGIRTTVFFKGCPLSCWWCHNPEGQKLQLDSLRPSEFHQIAISREISVQDLIAEIEKDSVFYDESGGGVTFSGGEPLVQPVFLEAILSECKSREIPTILDTCGYAPWNVIERIKEKIDLFLYDIKLLDDKRHQKYTNVSNSSILYNFHKLDSECKKIKIRFPVIPGITETEQEMKLMKNFIAKLKCTKHINLLPYHEIGKRKYERLGWVYKLEYVKPPTPTRLEQLKDFFTDLGLSVTIGG